MAIKKSELYSSLWASCDELRGGMDASQYKDYVLVLLFIKYISDKYAGVPYAPITVPKGASFKDMVSLKGKPSIGDDINKKIVGPISDANQLSDMPDFNDVTKLGSGKDQIDRLTNLIAIFENKALDFSKNRAEGDDILGDAYEYLMRHFATESGKSKGQFYTPAEVSRIIAKIIGINNEKTSASTTAYDPTCGSGSLLLKVADEAEKSITLYGQEKDSATSGLARMNMILHNNPTAEIKRENTLANPLFLNEHGALKTFDYVVANPPFSDKRWGNGVDTENDIYGRFTGFGVPPAKNGDYAFLLHIVRSLKSKGKGACVLPHGVLFRGGAEAEIRKNLIRKGYIKGIIGLPANLFYGTGIPACIVVVDKENAHNRKGIFMIDAGKGFMKDGNKNRLRNMDIHKIVEVFNKQAELPKYSRMVPTAEIESNEFNLNIPRYIDSQESEDIQDIEAHLLGDIPNTDIEALNNYWEVYPALKSTLFGKSKRANYVQLKVAKEDIKKSIFEHSEFIAYAKEMAAVFTEWKKASTKILKNLKAGFKPKALIFELSENLLQRYTRKKLIDKYDVYQHLMNYWDETMQDDCYIISADGWKAETYRIQVENKQKKMVDKGWTCDLIPKALVTDRFFLTEKQAIEALEAEKESIASQLTELEEEHSGEDGYFAEINKVNKGNVQSRLKEITGDADAKEEIKVLKSYLALVTKQADTNKKIKDAHANLDKKLYAKYPTLSEAEIKSLVVDDKWMAAIEKDIKTEMERINQRLTLRIKELAERYETPLPKQTSGVAEFEGKVSAHLKKMGFKWN
ncbi:type I restriction-modification system subunit M [Thermodesulfobacteriota bacterium]